MNYTYNLKPVTLYVVSQLYETYQEQAKKQGTKASELIRKAMQEYADYNFKAKNSFKDLDFSKTVNLKKGAKDFLNDESWKEDFISGNLKL